MPHRKGIYLWANGTRYEGQFERGFRLGKGVLSTLDGYSYKGTFIDEVAEGLCEIVYPNGDVYSGQFKNGKKNGKGTLISQGQRLEGYWTNDVLLGPLGCCSGGPVNKQ